MVTDAPTKPPPAADGENALVTISLIAGQSVSALLNRIALHPATYAIAMNGTRISQTFAIDWRPPRITAAVMSIRTMPVTWVLMPKLLAAIVEIEFACTMLPMPNDASTVNSAKRTPSHFM